MTQQKSCQLIPSMASREESDSKKISGGVRSAAPAQPVNNAGEAIQALACRTCHSRL